MERAHPAPTLQQVDAALYALAQQLRQYDGLAADLRDNVLHVTRWTGGAELREQITCAPRPDDGDRLWLWDHARRPVAQAGHPDAALAVARLLP